uniref:Uncharacterized protein n=1 Tax=Opuntia streptacantha TaxID=393608 RepID=A0A7C9F043_OPUST
MLSSRSFFSQTDTESVEIESDFTGNPKLVLTSDTWFVGSEELSFISSCGSFKSSESSCAPESSLSLSISSSCNSGPAIAIANDEPSQTLLSISAEGISVAVNMLMPAALSVTDSDISSSRLLSSDCCWELSLLSAGSETTTTSALFLSASSAVFSTLSATTIPASPVSLTACSVVFSALSVAIPALDSSNPLLCSVSAASLSARIASSSRLIRSCFNPPTVSFRLFSSSFSSGTFH